MSQTVESAPGKSNALKFGAIAALAAVLAALLGNEFFAAGGPAASTVDPGPEISRPSTRVAADSEAKAKRVRPTFPIEKVLSYDPFRLPETMKDMAQAIREDQEEQEEQKEKEEEESALAAKKAELQSALEKLNEEGVRTIVQTGRGNAALVGDRILREGDEVDGFVVVKISRDGIELAIKESE